MFYHLYEWLGPSLREAGFYDLNVLRYVSFRTAMAVVTAFTLMVLAGPSVIRRLMQFKLGDKPEFYNETLNRLTRSKENVPTMGGLLIVAVIVVSVLLWCNLRNPYIFLGLFVMIWLGGLGAADDILKIQGRKIVPPVRDGLKMHEKLLFQLGLGVIVGFYLMQVPEFHPRGLELWLPIRKLPLPLTTGLFMVMTTLVISGFSNAVNLTDGMDGLAAGCTSIACLVFIALCYIAGEVFWVNVGADQISARYWADFLNMPKVPGAQELTVFCGAMLGACLGFLWFNCHPAQVFMGDTGSLALGGGLSYTAVVTRNEFLLFIVGGVFVAEAASVMLQVGWFKFTRIRYGEGRRLLRMAPLHHHFQLGANEHDRQPEQKVVGRFWLVAAILAALGMAAVKFR